MKLYRSDVVTKALTQGSRRMDAKELAGKFAARVAAAVVERDKQKAVAADNAAKRSDDAEHCKRAMTDIVVPFLSELKSYLPDEVSLSPQVDMQDHKVIGVSFKIGDGPTITISTTFGNVIVTRSGSSGSSKGVSYVYAGDAEPYITNSGDLTKEKIAKLVDMAMDKD